MQIPRSPVPVEDFVQIQQLLARFAVTLDLGDLDAWVDCFVVDGEFGAVGTDATAPPLFVVKGHEQLLAQGKLMTSGPSGYHWNAEPAMELTDEGMRGLSYFMFVTSPEGRGEITVAGHYLDTFVKSDGRWRFSSRMVRTARDFSDGS